MLVFTLPEVHQTASLTQYSYAGRGGGCEL